MNDFWIFVFVYGGTLLGTAACIGVIAWFRHQIINGKWDDQ